jgi:iron complex outermembrane recepter protein
MNSKYTGEISDFLKLILVGMASGFPILSYANHEDIRLEAIQVTEVKPGLPDNVPNTVESVTAKQIEESANTVTTMGAFQYLPSMHVRERYIGDRNGILVMRLNSSIASAQTTVYADDLLISNFLNNSFSTPPRWGMVSPDMIERVDVMYGPFSALYPGNSAGGVLNITTRMPDKLEAHMKADVFTQNFKLYGTDKSFSGHHESASVGDKFDDLSLLIAVDHLDSHGQPQTFASTTKTTAGTATTVTGGYRDTDPQGVARIVTATTGMDHTVQNNVNLKASYDFTPTLKGSYTLGYWKNDTNISVDGYLKNAAGQTLYNTTSAGATSRIQFAGDPNFYKISTTAPSSADSEHWMHGISLKTNTESTWDWEAVASLYSEAKEQTRTFTPTDAFSNGSTGAGTLKKDDGTGWRTLDLRGDWRPDGNLKSQHQVSFGYHYDRYALESQTFNVTDWHNSGSGTLGLSSYGKTQTQAAYLQDAWAFAPKWKAVVGGRWENWQAFDGSNFKSGTGAYNFKYADREINQFSPKLSASYQLNDAWSLRGSYGRAYRFPTVAELFQVVSVNNVSSVNDPNLKPEKVNSFELSAEEVFASGLWRTSFFHEDKSDALISQTDTTTTPGQSVSSVQNVDKVRSNGIETSFQAEDFLFHGFDFTGSITYVDSEIIRDSRFPAAEGKPQPRVPRWRATMVGVYHFDHKLSLSLAGRYSGHQEVNLLYNTVDPDKYGTTVSQYVVFDTKLLYKANKQWSAYVGVNNLGNYKYYVNPNPYPQRTFFAGAKFDY